MPGGVQIGNRTIINEFCHLDGRGGLIIGNDTSISIYSKFITASHKLDSEIFEYFQNRTIIGDNVWIGANATVLDNSIIENFSVIGAGSVFKGKTEQNDVWTGNPSKLLKKRNIEEQYTIEYDPYFR